MIASMQCKARIKLEKFLFENKELFLFKFAM